MECLGCTACLRATTDAVGGARRGVITGFTALQMEARSLFCRLGVLYDMPGMFYIGKLLRNTPHREAFTVNSHGFWFRREVRQWPHLLVSGPPTRPSEAPDAGLPRKHLLQQYQSQELMHSLSAWCSGWATLGHTQ